MRSITSTLEAAQIASSRTPYIYLLFTSAGGGTTHNYTARLRQLQHSEGAYNDWAVIILRDDDRGIADIRGYWVEIGYGFVTSASNEYASTARLWVMTQQHISMEGVLHVRLELEGMWSILRSITLRLGSPPFYSTEYETDTVYAIIDAVLTEATASLQAGSFSLDALGANQDDSIVDTFTPHLFINQRAFENAASVMRRLIEMTKCYIRPKHSLAFEIRYPQDDDTADLVYYSDQQFYFKEYAEIKDVLTPNHILVFCNAGEDETWSNYLTGEAEDTAEQTRFMEVYDVQIAAEVTTQTDADNRASSILTRYKAEMLHGRLLIPHDCRVELYDKVAVEDSR